LHRFLLWIEFALQRSKSDFSALCKTLNFKKWFSKNQEEIKLLCNAPQDVKKSVRIILGPFRMALFSELWNAGHYRFGDLSWQ
jgi:hypothetical protein